MAVKTFYVTKDARVARRESDNFDQGSGTSTGLPFGLHNGYRYRVLLGFSINMTGWTAIVSATLHYRVSNQIHIAFGSDPDVHWSRITEAWAEGNSNGLSSSNAVVYPGPSTIGTNAVDDDVPTTENTWQSVSITAMMRDVLAGQPFYGIRGIAWDGTAESDSSSDVGEIYSREQGSDAYIVIEYETNRAPTCSVASPSVTSGISSGQTPSFNVTSSDVDNDQIASFLWQLDNNSDFTSPIVSTTVTGPWAQPHVHNVVAPTLTRGTTYYVRARAVDAKGTTSDWSTTFQFKVAAVPIVTLTEPSGAGRLGKTTYSPGSGWASPRLVTAWAFSCPDGGTQASFNVEIASDSGTLPGAALPGAGSGVLAQPATRQWTAPATFVEGSYYHVRVTCVCSHGVSSTAGYYRIRTRWGVVTHRHDMGATAISGIDLAALDVTDSVSGEGSGAVVVEHATTTGAAPAAYSASIASAGLNRYYWYRAWLLAWGATPAVSPTLNQLKITYDTVVIVPDGWTRQSPANAADDVGAYVYGTKSLKMVGVGSIHNVYQQIAVVPRTNYILSGRIQSQGDSGAQLVISSQGTGGGFASTSPVHITQYFDDETSRVFSGVWFSGENKSVFIRCYMPGAVGTVAWFDAIKLEASSVVTPWVPGFIANAVALDSGGIQIDAYAGGIFRLRGSAGTPRDEITLGTNGLVFGADTEIDSPVAGVFRTRGPAGVATIVRANAPAGQRAYLDAHVTGDSTPRMVVSGDATMQGIEFGPGNAARDVNLYRAGANQLKTDDPFDAAGVTVRGPLILPRAATVTALAATPIPITNSAIAVTTSGAVVSTAAPIIPDGIDGQLLTIIYIGGGSWAIRDESVLANSNVKLQGAGTTFTMNDRDVLTLIFISTAGAWLEISRSANA